MDSSNMCRCLLPFLPALRPRSNTWAVVNAGNNDRAAVTAIHNNNNNNTLSNPLAPAVATVNIDNTNSSLYETIHPSATAAAAVNATASFAPAPLDSSGVNPDGTNTSAPFNDENNNNNITTTATTTTTMTMYPGGANTHTATNAGGDDRKQAPPSDTTTTAVSHSGDAPTTLVDAIMEMSKNIKEMNEKIKDISARLEALEMASSGRQPVPNSNVATLPETRASKDELHATPVQVTLQSGDSVNSSLHGSNIANAGSSGEHTVVTLSSTGSESDRKPSAVVLTAEAVAGHNLNPHSEVVGTTAMITGHSMARREDASRAHAAGDGSSSGVAYGNANDLLNPIPIGQSDEGQESVGKNSTPDEASSDEK